MDRHRERLRDKGRGRVSAPEYTVPHPTRLLVRCAMRILIAVSIVAPGGSERFYDKLSQQTLFAFAYNTLYIHVRGYNCRYLFKAREVSSFCAHASVAPRPNA